MIDLSIHLITYNNEEHIEETIQSILKQKVDFNFEIVIGDDCSTDNTLKIIESYNKTHPNVFKIKKNEKQLGIFKNFKQTLDRCEGKYVFDIAGDDLLKHDYSLQKMVNTLKADTSLGFVDSGVDILFQNSNKIKEFNNKKRLQLPRETYIKEVILWKYPLYAGICFNKKLLYQYVDFDKYFEMNITFEDYPILVDLVMNTNFKTIKESLHIYRVHETSYSNKKSFNKELFLTNQEKKLFDYFVEKYYIEKGTVKTFNTKHYRKLLFLSGYFEKKELGKKSFTELKSKNIKDYIHYFASQNKLFRKLISIV